MVHQNIASLEYWKYSMSVNNTVDSLTGHAIGHNDGQQWFWTSTRDQELFELRERLAKQYPDRDTVHYEKELPLP